MKGAWPSWRLGEGPLPEKSEMNRIQGTALGGLEGTALIGPSLPLSFLESIFGVQESFWSAQKGRP